MDLAAQHLIAGVFTQIVCCALGPQLLKDGKITDRFRPGQLRRMNGVPVPMR